MATKLEKVNAKTAAELCTRFDLEGAEAHAILKDEMPPGEFFDLLIAKEYFPDAVRLLAYGLPARDAVNWACQCARERPSPNPKTETESALKAAESWVASPDDNRARAALEAAQAAELSTPEGCTAMAAFFSGENIAPAGAAAVPPPPDVAPKIVSGAILMAAVLVEPEHAAAHYRRFLDLGIQVANGKFV